MNTYSTEFFCTCPINNIRIKYQLRIETTTVVPVEQLVAKIESLDAMFHEEIADVLIASFGGKQTIVADHHSVTIETVRTE